MTPALTVVNSLNWLLVSVMSPARSAVMPVTSACEMSPAASSVSVPLPSTEEPAASPFSA